MSDILIIEDDARVLESLKMVLEDQGHKVHTARNGAMGLAELAENTFDLMITDVLMPDIDGIEVLLETRSQYPSMKTVVISGGGRIDSSNYLPTAAALGADQTLAKPFTNKELISCVNHLLS